MTALTSSLKAAVVDENKAGDEPEASASKKPDQAGNAFGGKEGAKRIKTN